MEMVLFARLAKRKTAKVAQHGRFACLSLAPVIPSPSSLFGNFSARLMKLKTTIKLIHHPLSIWYSCIEPLEGSKQIFQKRKIFSWLFHFLFEFSGGYSYWFTLFAVIPRVGFGTTARSDSFAKKKETSWLDSDHLHRSKWFSSAIRSTLLLLVVVVCVCICLCCFTQSYCVFAIIVITFNECELQISQFNESNIIMRLSIHFLAVSQLMFTSKMWPTSKCRQEKSLRHKSEL